MAQCKSCSNKSIQAKIEAINESDWLSQNEVLLICPECYENMVKNNITRIKKEVLIDKLGSKKMKFVEIMFKGNKGEIYNLGHISLLPYEPQYVEEELLPLTYYKLKKLDNLEVNKVELEAKPSDKEAKAIGAKKAGKIGIVWYGASPKKVNEYGTFVRGEPNFDLTEDQVKKLLRSGSFKLVG